jgi:hypothetical protein
MSAFGGKARVAENIDMLMVISKGKIIPVEIKGG